MSSLFARDTPLDHSPVKPHRLAFYLILFITQGTGVHYIDFRSYTYKKGDILFIAKGQVHAFEAQPDVDGVMLLFTEDFLVKNLVDSDSLPFHRLYNYHLHEPILRLSGIGESTVGNVIQEMSEEFRAADNFAKEEMLRLWLKLLMLKVERINQHSAPQQKESKWMLLFRDFRNLLEEQFQETRNAKEYAQMLNISYKHLNEACKSVTGKTAKEFIDAFLILETKRQLVISDISVKELTYKLGFDEPTNFVKFFRRHAGQSPVQFRKTFIGTNV